MATVKERVTGAVAVTMLEIGRRGVDLSEFGGKTCDEISDKADAEFADVEELLAAAGKARRELSLLKNAVARRTVNELDAALKKFD